MTEFLVKPKNQKEAELVVSVLKKMRIPMDVVEKDVDEEGEELIPFELFAEDLRKQVSSHFEKIMK